MQLVMAAISTAPSRDLELLAVERDLARGRWRSGFFLRALVGHGLERGLVDALRLAQRHAILRALRAGEAGLDRGEVELEHVGVVGGLGAVHAPQALRLGIGLDQRDLLRRAARQSQVAQRLLVDREDAAGAPYSGAMLAIVARSASGRFARPSPKNSTNLSTTPFLRSISVTVSTRSVAVRRASARP